VWALVAVGIGALALTFLLDQRSRRRCAGRDRSTLRVALLLSKQDEGLRLLAANVDRPAPWWATTPRGQLERIDEVLTGWGTVAGHIADGTVDLDVVLDACGRRIIAMWEDAYSYIEERHLALWEPLLDLYVAAWEAGHGDHSRFEDEHEEGLAVTPDEVPEASDLPADLLTPLLASAPVTAAAESEGAEEPGRLAVIQAALQPVTVSVADIPPPALQPVPVPAGDIPARRAVTARDVDTPADLLIDLVGTSGHRAEGPLPRAVHR
jgi:hypothetical protein